MALGHRLPWKITVHAKISNLYIKLKATVKCPVKFQRLLKLHKLLIQLDSKSESRILVQQRRTLKSRIFSFVKKQFRRCRSKTSAGFKMPDPYLVAETEYQSWRFGRAELSCVALFSYLLAEFGHTLNRNVGIIPSSSLFVLMCLALFVSWLHRFKFIWALLIAVVSLLLLQIGTFVELLDLEQFKCESKFGNYLFFLFLISYSVFIYSKF